MPRAPPVISATLPFKAIGTDVVVDSPDCISGRYSIFGIGVDRLTIVLVAFLYGKATPSESPQDRVLPKMLYRSCEMRATSDAPIAAYRALTVPFAAPQSASSARPQAWLARPACASAALPQRCHGPHAAVLPDPSCAAHSTAPSLPSARGRDRVQGRCRRSPTIPQSPRALPQRTVRRCCLHPGSVAQTSCRQSPYCRPRRPGCCPTAASPPRKADPAGRCVCSRCPCRKYARRELYTVSTHA